MRNVPKRRSERRTRPVILVVLAVVAVGMAIPVGASAGTRAGSVPRTGALFEGRLVDLSVDWGEASACLIWDEVGVRECLRSEAEMDRRITELENQPGFGAIAPTQAAQCSGSVRLYDAMLYTGQVLDLRDRLQWINLSAYGFSNKTTSFKIGPCDSYLADDDSGGGSWYSTSATQAWDMTWLVAYGWNNRVSSLYIR